jgi:abortive infection bacteriophage resistance protein
LPTVEILQGVLQGISLIRNICAHHGRLWNRRLVKPLPNIKKLHGIIQIEQDSHQPRKELFNYLVVICHMMKSLQPNTTWQERLSAHIKTINTDQQRAMGFPDGWQELTFFK